MNADAAIDDAPTAEYYPPPESQGGWRWLQSPEEIRTLGGMDPAQLERIGELFDRSEATCGVVIIHKGYLVAEWHENSALTTTRYDIWSCVKSFTGTAYGILFDDCRQGCLPPEQKAVGSTPAPRTTSSLAQ